MRFYNNSRRTLVVCGLLDDLTEDLVAHRLVFSARNQQLIDTISHRFAALKWLVAHVALNV